MNDFTLVAETDKYTVVGSYEPEKKNSLLYESEAALEKRFIAILEGQGYEYLSIKTEKDLIDNLRVQLERLNRVTFTDREWDRFFKEKLANEQEGIVEKTAKIQEDFVQVMDRDDGTFKNLKLIDKSNVHNNFLQVVNQYEASYSRSSSDSRFSRDSRSASDSRFSRDSRSASDSSETRSCRYDVTVLVNGLPLVHIELKRRGVAIKEAFNQIRRYGRDSFWAGTGLFQYVQLFVISNGTHTKYYSNTTRLNYLNEVQRETMRRGGNARRMTSNSFEFTSWWADAANRTIADLVDFAKTFFSKHVLLNILTRYCVFDTDRKLIVMRPYQIAATERILSRIFVAGNQKWMGSTKGGGYIWHTTGSGKTLTSFKTAILASHMEGVDKVLFVVDRSDLDYQTIKEYEKFQSGCANQTRDTSALESALRNQDPSKKITITTIQKLGRLVSLGKNLECYGQRCVIIFDECHRSQFGELHQKITKTFRNYQIFGFTGTPIFAVNAGTGGNMLLRTTAQAFGDQLHAYTIVDAIRDGNVLPFRIATVNTVREKEEKPDKRVRAIDTEEAMLDQKRIASVVRYILDNFDSKTYRTKAYTVKGVKKFGFNSILACASIPAAMKYYDEFKRQMAEGGRQLKVATIFTYSANEDDPEDGSLDAGGDPSELPQASRDFLESAIGDYNRKFDVSFSTNGEAFQNYYRDLSMRVKNREIDILIVVNMFLTGFDATTLNTLWVDKNLRMHGLIQAFSRTNRILNSVKTFGNIVCFRDLQSETDEAIGLFGDKDAAGIVLIRTFDEYFSGYTDENGKYVKGYKDLIADLLETFPLGEPVVGEKQEKDFIALWGKILRMRNLLSSFDEFTDKGILADRDMQDYQSVYIDMYGRYRDREKVEKESITDDVVFEMELVRQVEVNIDYILMLVARYHKENCKDKSVKGAIDKAIGSSLELRSKRELIEAFIASVNADGSVEEQWMAFVKEQKRRDLESLIAEENLKPDETAAFFEGSLRDDFLKTTGTDIDMILPPMSRFGGGNREEKKQAVIAKLQTLFERYKGLAE